MRGEIPAVIDHNFEDLVTLGIWCADCEDQRMLSGNCVKNGMICLWSTEKCEDCGYLGVPSKIIDPYKSDTTEKYHKGSSTYEKEKAEKYWPNLAAFEKDRPPPEEVVPSCRTLRNASAR